MSRNIGDEVFQKAWHPGHGGNLERGVIMEERNKRGYYRVLCCGSIYSPNDIALDQFAEEAKKQGMFI